ncbi:hypothetical protein JYT28_00315 [Desulfobulbus sp. AH-315-M07]|nr:hypothetical protein [Desulfobulbus sp. AH-315-M07]
MEIRQMRQRGRLFKQSVAAAGLAVAAAAGCNSLSGANDIVLVDEITDDDDGGSTADSGSTVATTGTFAGAGGATTGSGNTTGAGGGATTGSGDTTVASASGMMNPCEYPAGPYGVSTGDTVPPNLSWQGYGPGATESQSETFTMEQFHDCDGSRGINALLFDTSQYG